MVRAITKTQNFQTSSVQYREGKYRCVTTLLKPRIFKATEA